jgi:hypothetical protein
MARNGIAPSSIHNRLRRPLALEPKERTSMSNTICPELRAAIDAGMATAWTPPAEPSEEDLLKAEAEARRLAREWSSLAERQHESRDEEKALWSLLEHTNSLLDYLAAFRSKVPPRRRL